MASIIPPSATPASASVSAKPFPSLKRTLVEYTVTCFVIGVVGMMLVGALGQFVSPDSPTSPGATAQQQMQQNSDSNSGGGSNSSTGQEPQPPANAPENRAVTPAPTPELQAPVPVPEPQAPLAEKPEPQPEVAQYGIGDTLESGSFRFRVVSVSDGPAVVGGEYFNSEPEGRYVVVRVYVENVGMSEDTFFDDDVAIIDQHGRKMSPDSSAAIYADDSKWISSLNPGISFEANLYFDIPVDAQPTKVQFDAGWFSPTAEANIS